MKKEEMVKMVENYGGVMNAETGRMEMTENKFNTMKGELSEELKIGKLKGHENVHGMANNTSGAKALLKIEIVEKKPKTIKQSENVESFGGHKGKGDSYIIKFKKKDDKKETKITDMTTCAEIKAWMKTISKKQMEYLHIFNSKGMECRKSAWIG